MDIKGRADASAKPPPLLPPAVAPVPPVLRMISAQEAVHAPAQEILLRGFFGSGN
jgi:hypothetical protein